MANDSWAVGATAPLPPDGGWKVGGSAPVSTGGEIENVAASGALKSLQAYSDVVHAIQKAGAWALSPFQSKEMQAEAQKQIKAETGPRDKFYSEELKQYHPDTAIGQGASDALGFMGEAPLFTAGAPLGDAAAAVRIVKAAPKLTSLAETILRSTLEGTGSFAGEAALRGESGHDIAQSAKQGAEFGLAGEAGKMVGGKFFGKAGAAVGQQAGIAGSMIGNQIANGQPINTQSLLATAGLMATYALAHHAVSAPSKIIALRNRSKFKAQNAELVSAAKAAGLNVQQAQRFADGMVDLENKTPEQRAEALGKVAQSFSDNQDVLRKLAAQHPDLNVAVNKMDTEKAQQAQQAQDTPANSQEIPALPAPKPSDMVVVDEHGNARPLNEAEADQYRQAMAGHEALGGGESAHAVRNPVGEFPPEDMPANSQEAVNAAEQDTGFTPEPKSTLDLQVQELKKDRLKQSGRKGVLVTHGSPMPDITRAMRTFDVPEGTLITYKKPGKGMTAEDVRDHYLSGGDIFNNGTNVKPADAMHVTTRVKVGDKVAKEMVGDTPGIQQAAQETADKLGGKVETVTTKTALADRAAAHAQEPAPEQAPVASDAPDGAGFEGMTKEQANQHLKGMDPIDRIDEQGMKVNMFGKRVVFDDRVTAVQAAERKANSGMFIPTPVGEGYGLIRRDYAGPNTVDASKGINLKKRTKDHAKMTPTVADKGEEQPTDNIGKDSEFLFSRTDGTQDLHPSTKGLGVGDVTSVVHAVAAHLKDAPTIAVHKDASTFPDHIKEQMGHYEGAGRTEAVYDPQTDTIHLAANNIYSHARAFRVMAHELMGHYSLTHMMEPGEFKSLTNEILDAAASDKPEAQLIRDEFMEVAKLYRHEVGGRELDPENPLAGLSESEKQEMAEEVLARFAEKGRNDLPLMQRAIAAVRRWLRATFGARILVSDKDVMGYMAKAKRTLTLGDNARQPTGEYSAARASIRIVHDDSSPRSSDPVVPETPEFAHSHGDLGHVAENADHHIEGLPVRLTYGVARGEHKGFGLMHIADNGDKFPHREPASITGNRGEDIVRAVAHIAQNYDRIYHDGSRLVLATKDKKALVVEATKGNHGEGRYYSVVSMLPDDGKWGDSVAVGRDHRQPEPAQAAGNASTSRGPSDSLRARGEHPDVRRVRVNLHARGEDRNSEEHHVTVVKRRAPADTPAGEVKKTGLEGKTLSLKPRFSRLPLPEGEDRNQLIRHFERMIPTHADTGKDYTATPEQVQRIVDKAGDGYLYRVSEPPFIRGGKEVPHYVHTYKNGDRRRSLSYSTSLKDTIAYAFARAERDGKPVTDYAVYRVRPDEMTGELPVLIPSERTPGELALHVQSLEDVPTSHVSMTGEQLAKEQPHDGEGKDTSGDAGGHIIAEDHGDQAIYDALRELGVDVPSDYRVSGPEEDGKAKPDAAGDRPQDGQGSRESGHDALNGGKAGAIRDSGIKNAARFSRSAEGTGDVHDSIDAKIGPEKTVQSAVTKVRAAVDEFKARWVQKIFDQYDPLKSKIGDKRAWMMAHLARSAPGAVEAMIQGGKLELYENALRVVHGTKGLHETLKPLGDSKEIERFFKWIVGNRAERLMAEGRENLLTEDEIAALKDYNKGALADGTDRQKVYDSVLKGFTELHDSVLDVAEATGLVGPEDIKLWKEQGFYVPFYRLIDEEQNPQGPGSLSGSMVNLKAFRKLKGGKDVLNDPLHNVLMNWHHLLNASLNNQAAVHALASAGPEVAEPIKEKDKTKGSVYVLVDGKKLYYDIHDPAVAEALTSMSYRGRNSTFFRVMGKFKHYLTLGVTSSPQFRIRNLLRDSITAIAATPVSGNAVKNIKEGWIHTEKGSKTYLDMLAGGGMFGHSGYVYGGDAEAIKKMVEMGVDHERVLTNPKAVAKALWHWWQNTGARGENINRAANWAQDAEKGVDLLTRNFNSRDHLDFTSMGSSMLVRDLAQVVPFLNARLQGLYKLGRAYEDPAQRGRFIATIGAYTMAGLALYMYYKDDPEYRSQEEWVHMNYHAFKLDGKWFYIPRPFEVGAIGYLAEKGLEQVVDPHRHAADFGNAVWSTLMNTFSFNPVPQALKPMVELMANEDWFTGRKIESDSMANLSPDQRFRPDTSATAKEVSKGMEKVLGDNALSPVQLEYLTNAYFGWLGSFILGSSDIAVRRLTGAPAQPSWLLSKSSMGFASDGPQYNTRYLTSFYNVLSQYNEITADINNYRKRFEPGKAQQLRKDNEPLMRAGTVVKAMSGPLKLLRQRATAIQNNKTMSSEEKRAKLDEIQGRIDELSKRAYDNAIRDKNL